ncbi:hypothetical protein GPL20_17105 [Bradyrhizobium cajani]|uniref:Uncharacterized protein n=1 Tax=Bradyrhizobium cajani TaxID=1928661 RepID=A0A844T6H9_9BRAD|nr:hypothetical protein [Bradyrhizobium cajani]
MVRETVLGKVGAALRYIYVPHGAMPGPRQRRARAIRLRAEVHTTRGDRHERTSCPNCQYIPTVT